MGPYKCPDCGVWWAGFEHRCQPVATRLNTQTITVRCTCSFDPKGHRIPNTALCPVHDVSITYTTAGSSYGTGVVLRADSLGRLT